MTVNRQHEDEQKLDRATVLLSLLSTDDGRSGRCLSIEEIAVLADDGYAGTELEDKWQHLCDCDICYRQWLSVKTARSAKKKRGRLYFLGTPAGLGYIGSALAVAASVVIYLNVYNIDADFREEPVVEQLQMADQSRESMIAPASSRPAQRKKRQGPPEPVFSKSASPAADASGGQFYAMPKVSANMVKRRGKKNISNENAAAVEQWLKTVLTECRSGREDIRFWSDIRRRGEKLAVRVNGMELQRATLFGDVFTLVVEVSDKDSLLRQCPRIISKYGESKFTTPSRLR